MIFNENNVKVIRDNGYLNKYVNKVAPYFPFTEEDAENNLLVLIDASYRSGHIFYLISCVNDIAYFISFSEHGTGIYILNFNFITYKISINQYSWGKN